MVRTASEQTEGGRADGLTDRGATEVKTGLLKVRSHVKRREGARSLLRGPAGAPVRTGWGQLFRGIKAYGKVEGTMTRRAFAEMGCNLFFSIYLMGCSSWSHKMHMHVHIHKMVYEKCNASIIRCTSHTFKVNI